MINARKSVAAVISAYNPPRALLESVSNLGLQMDCIVVVDDGSSDAKENVVLAQLEEMGVFVVRHLTNRGIAAALNTGIAEAARRIGPQFYLTLDQDSILDDGYISKAMATYNYATESNLSVGFICAASYNRVAILLDTPVSGFQRPFDPWQSGLLVPKTTFDQVGYFADEFFIDCVDSEFTMRVRKHGLDPIVGRECNVQHTIGESCAPILFGRHISFGGRLKSYSAHSATRVYYMSRNGAVLSWRYSFIFPSWLLRKNYYELKNQIVRVIFGRNRAKLMLAMFAGIFDAAAGRRGRINRIAERFLA